MTRRAPRERLLARILEQHRIHPFSGLIDIRQEGEVVLSQAFGFANLPERIPNTLQTRFGMASGSKTFTAVAICQLVERGVMGFDTRLLDCLHEPLPGFDPNITLHHLLTHSSGVPDYFDEEETDDYEAVWNDHPAYTFREPADFLPLFKALPMKFKPGTRFSYSNSGFIVLGLVIEHLTGKPYISVIDDEILKPAGMTRSGFFCMDQLPEGTALGYIPQGEGVWRSNIYSIPIVGGADGGAFTTGDDLAKFWERLFDCKLIRKENLQKMLNPYLRTNPKSSWIFYGYGIWIGIKKRKPEVYYMLGEDPGVAYYSGYFPEKKLLFTLLGNTSEAAFRMLERLLPVIKSF
jgi:CubicO group peptidase (beta-lactamase class C family)